MIIFTQKMGNCVALLANKMPFLANSAIFQWFIFATFRTVAFVRAHNSQSYPKPVKVGNALLEAATVSWTAD